MLWNVQPPFREYHFIDLNVARVESLQRIAGSRNDIHVYEGDCNEVLIQTIFSTLRFESYRRALCLLDPYGLDLNWDVMFKAGQLGTIDMFLNFPVMDMNRNVLWRNPDKVSDGQLARMNVFWGGDWKGAAYATERSLFGEPEKESNDAIAEAFRRRLQDIAGFKKVPEPLPLHNSKGATVYYLFFASQVGVAEKIVTDIFAKYRKRGEN
jgi:three-Cys-motif partner protein